MMKKNLRKKKGKMLRLKMRMRRNLKIRRRKKSKKFILNSKFKTRPNQFG